MDLRVLYADRCTLAGATEVLHGVTQVGQKFMLELLTELGSMIYLPQQGCNFLQRLRKHSKTEFDVIVAFSSAHNKVRRTLRSEETKYTPPNERFADAYLTQIIIQPGGVLVLEIAVRNMLGEVVQFTTPPIIL